MRKILILLSLLPSLLFGQIQIPQLDALDSFINEQVIEYGIPGLAIGIIKEDKVIFKKGYGLTSAEKGYPVTTRTVFPIASCTKAFTAAVIGILVDEGQLDWDDKVVSYLPVFKHI